MTVEAIGISWILTDYFDHILLDFIRLFDSDVTLQGRYVLCIVVADPGNAHRHNKNRNWIGNDDR